LINVKGEVIGVNVAVFREQNAEGIGSPYRSSAFSEALSEMFTPESVKQLWFGAKVKAGLLPLTVIKVSRKPGGKSGSQGGRQIVQ